MPKKQKKSKRLWFLIALIALVASAPNAMITRIFVSGPIDSFLWVVVRALLVAVILLPLVVARWSKFIKTRARLRAVLFNGVLMAAALISHAQAIALSSASYVSTIVLLYPIILVVISSFMFKERITRRIMAGVGIAACGGSVLVLLPFAFSGGDYEVNTPATLLSVTNLFTFAFAIAGTRKLNNQGVSIPFQIGVNSIIMAIIACVLFWLFGDPSHVQIDMWFIMAAIYSSVGIMLLARWLSTLAFGHVGAALFGALTYVESFLAILLPVFILGETLSITMVIGGILIMAGIYILEYYKHPTSKHHVAHRHQ